MFPLELVIGSVKINTHFIFEIMAFAVGYRYYLYLRKNSEDAISEPNRVWIIIGAAAGALFFSRFIGALENPQAWINSGNPFLYFYLSKTIVGGLAGGLLGVEMIKKSLSIKQSSGDLFTFPIILGMMIGRVGCYFSGLSEQTYGIETSLIWGVDFGDGVFRHPVSLYEIFFLAIFWFGINAFQSRYKLEPGYLFKFFMIYYFSYRFFSEFIKPVGVWSMGLSAIQLTCLLVLVYYGQSIIKVFLGSERMVSKR